MRNKSSAINNSEIRASIVQFIKFGMVGVSNTLLSYFLNICVLLLLFRFDLRWDYVIANTVAFIISVFWSFCWNNKFVFKKEDGQQRSWWKTLIKTYVAYSFTGLILSNVLSWVWIDCLGISKIIAPALNLIISIPINFILNKFWAYK